MPLAHDTTTIRVSRRTHQVFSQLAAEEGRSITELLDELAEKARRQRILDQSAARMAEIMADADERRSYLEELELSEALAADAMRDEPPYGDPQGA
jgi:arginine deiminase